MRRLLLASPLVLASLLPGGTAQAAERPAARRLCPEDLPADAHLPPQPGCEWRPPRESASDDGFRDVGNGVSVRVNGRAGAEFGARR